MLENFGTLGLFFVVALLFPLLLLGLPLTLRYTGVIPRKPSPVKEDTYECGMMPFHDAWTQFNFRYYMYAILFVVLDLMSVVLFPWAAHFVGLSRSAQIRGLIGVAVFVGILLLGFLYAWKKKALEWK